MEIPAPSWMALERYVTGEAILDADPAFAIEALDEAVDLARRTDNDFILNVARLSAVSLRGRHFDVDEALQGYLEVVESWRRAGNWLQQWVTLRNLVELFARLGLDASATTLFFAAEASPSAGPLIGAHGERLQKLLVELESRLGADVFAGASERGARMRGDEAVAFALEEIHAVLAQRDEAAAV